MFPSQQYNSTSLMRFQMSILCLGAALDQAAPVGSKEIAVGALVEAERLRSLIESREGC